MNKRFQIFTLILGIFIVPVFSQDLSELLLSIDIIKINTEMKSRHDQNGSYCAVIQVESDIDGFSYNSNSGIVGKIKNNSNKDIIYLSSAVQVFEINKSGFKPVNIVFSEYGIELAPLQAWQITIKEKVKLDSFQVKIDSEPNDASIFIDGEFMSENIISLTEGDYYVRIEKQGYETFENIFTVNENQNYFGFKMQRLPSSGIYILSSPKGATVYIDGDSLGVTPFRSLYLSGLHLVTLNKAGYFPIEDQTIEIIPPLTRKNFNLDLITGTLKINSFASADIYINDQLILDTNELILPPQLFQIKVVMPNAEPIEQQGIMHANEELEFNLFPDVKVGTIQVDVFPADAHIELSGSYGQKFDAGSSTIFKEIPIDTYKIKVTANGYILNEVVVELRENDTITEDIQLDEMENIIKNKYGIQMLPVTGGTFIIGCESKSIDCEEDESPAHEVSVNDFHIGKYEVTQKQWNYVMGSSPSYFYDCENCPVENVSWNDVQSFITVLNSKTRQQYRLPTEAEWEFAAQGGNLSKGFLYAGSNSINDVAWYWRNSGDYELEGSWAGEKLRPNNCKPKIVGQKNANELGIFDMSGNVWEWCSDFYENDYYEKSLENNPFNNNTGPDHVCRGGSWGRTKNHCTTYTRKGEGKNKRLSYLGFRLAHDSK